MKRFVLLLLVVALLPATMVHAFVVSAGEAAIIATLEGTWIEQAVYLAQQAVDMVKSIAHLQSMVKNMEKQINAQVNNLKNVTQVRSYQDFMNWNNRQLYLERMTEESWNNMNVTIGKKSYHITDVEGMGYGLKDTYVEYWDKEFTEDQRKDMWVRLGLTPANYAYIQTWQEREREIMREFLTAREIHNKNYQKEMKRNKDNLDVLEKDKEKDEDDQMGEKGILVINTETAIATNKTINDVEGHLADIKEIIAVNKYEERTPIDTPPMSEWDKGAIKPLK